MSSENLIEPADPQALATALAALRGRGVHIVGGGTKPSLLPPRMRDTPILSTRQMVGIADYEPSEFTVTAYAGTPLERLAQTLAEHGQYLPFDPPFSDRGATLGGAIAAGLAGPGRVRFGGVRDFVLAVRFADGQGRLLRGGAKVVKNAAGFDLPKLLVGSLGRLAAITEITLKVLPKPMAYRTACFAFRRFRDALGALNHLRAMPLDLEALELTAPATLLVRVGGPAASLAQRLERVAQEIDAMAEHASGEAEEAFWRRLAKHDDLEGSGGARVHVAARASSLDALVTACDQRDRHWHIGSGGAALWLTVAPERLAAFDRDLARLRLGGLVLAGADDDDPRIGHLPGGALLRRLRSVFDPDDTFPRWREIG